MSDKKILGQAVIYYRCQTCDDVLTRGSFLIDEEGDVCRQIECCKRCLATAAKEAKESVPDPEPEPDATTIKRLDNQRDWLQRLDKRIGDVEASLCGN